MHYAGRIPLYTREALDRYAERRIGPARRSTSEAGCGRTAPTEKARTKTVALAGDHPRPAKIELLR